MTASPATMPCCWAPTVTATSPVTMPTRIARLGHADLAPIAATAVDQLEPGADRALGVVLVGRRHAPDGHHRVADELLDGAAVAGDDAALVEVARQQLADVLLVALSDSVVNPTRSPNRTLVTRRATGASEPLLAGPWA